jgi:hypothetical protein
VIIRILLLAAIAAIGWFVFLRRNKLPFHIVMVFALLGAGATAVISPDTIDTVAHLVGVGRGADLVTYFSLVGVLFVLIHYYSKFVELQRNLTTVTRDLAILRTELEHDRPARSTNPPSAPAEPRPSPEP